MVIENGIKSPSLTQGARKLCTQLLNLCRGSIPGSLRGSAKWFRSRLSEADPKVLSSCPQVVPETNSLSVIVVDLMPRVGGLGIKFFSGTACGQDESTFGSASLKPDRNPFAIRRKDPGLLPRNRFRSCVHSFRAPCVRDGDLIPFSMTMACCLIQRGSLHTSS